MAKVAFIVDRAKLEKAVETAEGGGPVPTRSELYKRVSDLYNNDSPPKVITASVVALRLKDWNVNLKTPVGKRGRPKSVKEVVEA